MSIHQLRGVVTHPARWYAHLHWDWSSVKSVATVCNVPRDEGWSAAAYSHYLVPGGRWLLFCEQATGLLRSLAVGLRIRCADLQDPSGGREIGCATMPFKPSYASGGGAQIVGAEWDPEHRCATVLVKYLVDHNANSKTLVCHFICLVPPPSDQADKQPSLRLIHTLSTLVLNNKYILIVSFQGDLVCIQTPGTIKVHNWKTGDWCLIPSEHKYKATSIRLPFIYVATVSEEPGPFAPRMASFATILIPDLDNQEHIVPLTNVTVITAVQWDASLSLHLLEGGWKVRYHELETNVVLKIRYSESSWTTILFCVTHSPRTTSLGTVTAKITSRYNLTRNPTTTISMTRTSSDAIPTQRNPRLYSRPKGLYFPIQYPTGTLCRESKIHIAIDGDPSNRSKREWNEASMVGYCGATGTVVMLRNPLWAKTTSDVTRYLRVKLAHEVDPDSRE